MITVHLVGLMYFDACRVDDKRVLLPNGMACGMGGHPPHYTSIWVEANRYESDDWWDDSVHLHRLPVKEDTGSENRIFVYEFRLPETAELSFSVKNGTVDIVNLERGLPRLQPLKFKLDLDRPNAVAGFAIPSGRLEAFKLKRSGVVKWRLDDHDDPFVITATVGKRTRKITLRRFDEVNQNPTAPLQAEGIEVVVSNAPDFIKPHSHHHQPDHDDHGSAGHFRIYGRLDADRKSENLAKPDLSMIEKLPDVTFDHAFLRFLINKPQIPEGECTPSCC